MRRIELKKWYVLLLLPLFMMSCSEDESLADDADVTIEELNRGRNDGGRTNGGNGRDTDFEGADLVNEWMDLFLELDRFATGMRPNATSRSLAYINLAAYETVQPFLDQYRSNESQLRDLNLPDENNRVNTNYLLALNACYADVFDHFIYNISDDLNAKIAALETEQEELLSRGVSTQVLEVSKNWGGQIAAAIIEYGLSDLEAEGQIYDPQPLSYEPPVGDGFWTYSAEQERALFPYWKSVRTFIVDADETTTLDPIAYSENPNSAYFKEMKEVYDVNNTAREEDNEELWIAEFWSDDVEGLVFSPPARQISIANQFIDLKNLDLGESLYLLLKVGFALNDAAVSTWEYKYEHMVMRPNVFIHEFIDADYQTNLYRLIPWPNPTFPGYPSGHSAFASAAGGVFIDFFGDRANFTDKSHEGRTEFRGTPRRFETFSKMAEENAFSRIPLGVHIRMDCVEGLRLGYEISDGINAYELKRRST